MRIFDQYWVNFENLKLNFSFLIRKDSLHNQTGDPVWLWRLSK